MDPLLLPLPTCYPGSPYPWTSAHDGEVRGGRIRIHDDKSGEFRGIEEVDKRVQHQAEVMVVQDGAQGRWASREQDHRVLLGLYLHPEDV